MGVNLIRWPGGAIPARRGARFNICIVWDSFAVAGVVVLISLVPQHHAALLYPESAPTSFTPLKNKANRHDSWLLSPVLTLDPRFQCLVHVVEPAPGGLANHQQH